MKGACRAVVRLDRLAENLAAARKLLPQRTKIYGVVKANGYGHGALPVARALERFGVCGLAVDSVDEGVALRDGGVRIPILVLNPLLPEEATLVAAHGLTAAVASFDAVHALDAAAGTAGRRLPVHVRVRADRAGGLGADHDLAEGLLQRLGRLEHLHAEGLFMQMIGTYRDDPRQIDQELSDFRALLARVEGRGLRPPLVHAITSPGLLNTSDAAFDMVRLGAVLYGIRMNPPDGRRFPFRPVMEVVSRIAFIADMVPGGDVGYGGDARLATGGRLATISLGYADAPFLLRFKDTAVLIRGQRAPLVGEAFMGMVLADISAIPEAALSDEVVVVGAQGADAIRVEDIGRWNGIRPSAVLMLGPRARRVYVGGDPPVGQGEELDRLGYADRDSDPGRPYRHA
ncbi:hypothetical protein TSO352_31200 [Azospirillum sp. TSO35-2]|nr:hypothetical protein TSO352_31200 [Azospirillum sp. TSO35-2]